MSAPETLKAAASSLPGTASAPAALDFAKLYASQCSRVQAICFGITRNAQDAEDAAQETFLSIQRALPGFRGEAQLSTWVYRIAVTTSLAIRARSTRHAGVELDDAQPDPGAPVDDAVDARRQQARLARAMAMLSAEHQTVLTLFALEGLSHREIAEVLDIKEGTVWSRLHLARKRLAQLLEAPDA